jgi:cyanophycin synthetase
MEEYKETAGSCAECGNSPINHTLSYVVQSIGVLTSIMHFHSRTITARVPSVFFSASANWISRIHYAFLSLLRIVTFKHDVSKAKTYRSQVVWESAQERHIPMEQIAFYGYPSDIYRAKINNKWFYFESLPFPPNAKSEAILWMDDKVLLKQHLKKNNIPVPRSFSVTKLSDALTHAKSLQDPVIIKPRMGSRGRHTHTYITDSEDIAYAFNSAQKLCHFVVIEEHLRGPVCRATTVGGKLVGFFEGQPPYVVGDGQNTIAELVLKKNTNKPERVNDIIINTEHEAFLKRQGFSLETVLDPGHKVYLLHRAGRLFGGETKELLDEVHPELTTIIEKAAKTFETPIIGFDLIIQDPTADPSTQKWGIIEANSLPYIDLHYLPLYGKPSKVADKIWDMWNV